MEPGHKPLDVGDFRKVGKSVLRFGCTSLQKSLSRFTKPQRELPLSASPFENSEDLLNFVGSMRAGGFAVKVSTANMSVDADAIGGEDGRYKPGHSWKAPQAFWEEDFTKATKTQLITNDLAWQMVKEVYAAVGARAAKIVELRLIDGSTFARIGQHIHLKEDAVRMAFYRATDAIGVPLIAKDMPKKAKCHNLRKYKEKSEDLFAHVYMGMEGPAPFSRSVFGG